LMSTYRMPATLPVPDVQELGADTMLPGLRGLAKLTDCRPVIVVDTREQAPLKFERLIAVPGTLHSGDNSTHGLEASFVVERKSVGDLANCYLAGQRDRFEHELHRMHGYRFKRLLIVGTREDVTAGRYHSKIASKAILSTLGAFEVRYDLPVVLADTLEAAAREIERWAWWFSREVTEDANNLLRGCKEPVPSSPLQTQHGRVAENS
jgi:ERCC4-type nuclease